MAHLTHGSDSTPMRFSSEEQEEEEVSTSVAISNEHRNSLPVTEKLPSVTPLFHQGWIRVACQIASYMLDYEIRASS